MSPERLPSLALPEALPSGLGVTTPSPFYCAGDEFLRVTSFGSVASVALAVCTRFLRTDGSPVAGRDRHVPNSDRTIASSDFHLPDGWLLGVEVHATAGAPRRGQVWVVVDLMRGASASAVLVQTLTQGYITDTSRLAWPGSPIRDSAEGPGVLRSITGTNPAAGVELSEAVPTNARWRLHAIQFTLVTAVAAANREVALTFDDGAAVFARVPSGFTHIASTTVVYSAFHHAPRNTAAQDTTKNFPIPRIDLQGGFRINTVTTAIQAADDYGAPQYLVEEWIED